MTKSIYPGVLVLNKKIKATSNAKCHPHHDFRPMVVILKTHNGLYHFAEIDGTISKLRFAAFQIISYHTHSLKSLPVTHSLILLISLVLLQKKKSSQLGN